MRIDRFAGATRRERECGRVFCDGRRVGLATRML